MISEQLLKVNACLCRMSIQKMSVVAGLPKTPEVGLQKAYNGFHLVEIAQIVNS